MLSTQAEKTRRSQDQTVHLRVFSEQTKCSSVHENISIQMHEVSVYHQKRTMLQKKDRCLLLYWILKTCEYSPCCREWNNTMTQCAFISSRHCERDLMFSISDSEHGSIFFLTSFSLRTVISHTRKLTPLSCHSYLLMLFAAVILCINFALGYFILTGCVT